MTKGHIFEKKFTGFEKGSRICKEMFIDPKQLCEFENFMNLTKMVYFAKPKC